MSERSGNTTRAAERPSVAAVLRRALILIRQTGWASTHWTREQDPGLTIAAAIQRAGEASVACFYAKLHLTACLGFPYTQWESVQWRTEAEVFAFLRQAIRVAEGRTFQQRAGGWAVSRGPGAAPRSSAVAGIKSKAGVR